VPAGESLGDSSELISIVGAWNTISYSCSQGRTRDRTLLSLATFTGIQKYVGAICGTIANYRSLGSCCPRSEWHGTKGERTLLWKSVRVANRTGKEGGGREIVCAG
jgi:hypothetical protein